MCGIDSRLGEFDRAFEADDRDYLYTSMGIWDMCGSQGEVLRHTVEVAATTGFCFAHDETLSRRRSRRAVSGRCSDKRLGNVFEDAEKSGFGHYADGDDWHASLPLASIEVTVPGLPTAMVVRTS